MSFSDFTIRVLSGCHYAKGANYRAGRSQPSRSGTAVTERWRSYPLPTATHAAVGILMLKRRIIGGKTRFTGRGYGHIFLIKQIVQGHHITARLAFLLLFLFCYLSILVKRSEHFTVIKLTNTINCAIINLNIDIN